MSTRQLVLSSYKYGASNLRQFYRHLEGSRIRFHSHDVHVSVQSQRVQYVCLQASSLGWHK